MNSVKGSKALKITSSLFFRPIFVRFSVELVYISDKDQIGKKIRIPWQFVQSSTKDSGGEKKSYVSPSPMTAFGAILTVLSNCLVLQIFIGTL